MPEVYMFDRETGVYQGARVAPVDPLKGTPMLPADATFLRPPNTLALEAAVWTDGAWAVVPDFRGHGYWLPDGSAHTIQVINERPPEGALYAAPPEKLEDLKAVAARTVAATVDDVVAQFAENPSRREVTSWTPKIAVSKAVLDGSVTEAPSLVPVMIKHGVDLQGAAARVLLNARLYEFVNSAAETVGENALAAIQAATTGQEVDDALSAFEVNKALRLNQLAAITVAARAGDMTLLEAAEAEINAEVEP